MVVHNSSESSSDEDPKLACSPLKNKIGQYDYGQGDAAILSQTKSSSYFRHPMARGYEENTSDIALWNAVILAEAAIARAEIKRKRENEAQQEYLENQSISSLQDLLYAERRRVAKFNTIEDMKVAQDIIATFDGIMKVDAEKANILNYHINPIHREKLLDEISWCGENVIFPVHKVEPALQEEKKGTIRSIFESAVPVNQGVASMIENIAEIILTNQWVKCSRSGMLIWFLRLMLKLSVNQDQTVSTQEHKQKMYSHGVLKKDLKEGKIGKELLFGPIYDRVLLAQRQRAQSQDLLI
ncbi:MAG: hypothetical protein EZS28_019139, partial [Streblomastix strix]